MSVLWLFGLGLYYHSPCVFNVEFLARILLLFSFKMDIYQLYMELYIFIYWNFSLVYKDSFTSYKIQQWINI